MTVVDLNPRIFEQVRWIARWQKVTADELATRQYVAMHEDQVIDHDADLRTLHSRVYAQMGSIPVLLQKVTATPVPDILVRSPRLAG